LWNGNFAQRMVTRVFFESISFAGPHQLHWCLVMQAPRMKGMCPRACPLVPSCTRVLWCKTMLRALSLALPPWIASKANRLGVGC
jgi:hypothetical protein